MGHVHTLTPACYRQDLTKTAIVFGSLLVAAAALCGTLDMARPVAPIDEVQALNDEYAIGPAGLDLHAFECGERKTENGHFQLASQSASNGLTNTLKCRRHSAPNRTH